MIAKLALLFAAVAAASATIPIGAGLLAPGLIGSPAAIRTGSVVTIPGAVTTDNRVIGVAPALLAGAPLLTNGIIGNGILANGVVANSLVANGLIRNGIVGAAPLGIAPWGAGIVAAPGIAKAIL